MKFYLDETGDALFNVDFIESFQIVKVFNSQKHKIVAEASDQDFVVGVYETYEQAKFNLERLSTMLGDYK